MEVRFRREIRVPSIAEILGQAKAYHAAGDLPRAEQLYRRILQADAANVEACQLLGIVCQGLGKPDEAIAFLRKAIRLKPDDAETRSHLGAQLAAQGKLDEAILNFEQACRLRPESAQMSDHLRYALVTKNNRLGNELAAQGNLDQAVACYRRALELKPDIAELHNNLGTVLSEQGQLDEATACFRRALELNPGFAEAHRNLGAELAKQAMRDEAAACFRRALELNPNYARAHQDLGAVLVLQGQFDEAADCCRRALELKPDDAEAHANLGFVMASQKRLDDAAAHYRRALELNPGIIEAHNNLGTVLVEQEKFDEAAACFLRTMELNPNSALAHQNLAGVLTRQEKYDEAIASFRRALELEPDNALTHYSLGTVLGDQQKLDEAGACFRRALELDPDYAEAHHGYAFVLLSQAQFADGWREYEWRWKLKDYEGPVSSQPRWTSAAGDDRTVLLFTEGGAGDALQFIRYAELVKQRCGTVMVECRRELSRLLATCAGVDRVAVRGEPLPKFDAYVPLLSLPGVFGTSLENIPAKVPYLWPNQELAQAWNDELSEVRELKVGIAWQGNAKHVADRFRSIPLAKFAGIARLRGIRLYSLQMGAGREQLTELAGQFSITDLGDRLGDFYNTAAAMVNLDLVITCDSAPAHLAGALGVPVWVALAFSPDWRWLKSRTDNPWYPTMRLFRQPAHRDWDSVVGRIEEALMKMVKLRTEGGVA